MKLLIIGNGFDLFHSLPTHYNEFKKYLHQIGKTKLVDTVEKFLTDRLWSDFENALGEVDIDCIDIDDEEQVDELDEDLIYIYDNYKNRLLISVEELTNHFADWVKSINVRCEKMLSEDIINNQNLYVSFNYTQVLEEIYNINPNNILHIHGEAFSQENPIICGQCKHYNDDEELVIFSGYDEGWDYDPHYVQVNEILIKYFRCTYKNTSAIIEKNISFFNALPSKGIQEVIILGHSLGEADKPYIAYLVRLLGASVKWTATYYKDYEKSKFKSALSSLEIPDTNINLLKMETYK